MLLAGESESAQIAAARRYRSLSVLLRVERWGVAARLAVAADVTDERGAARTPLSGGYSRYFFTLMVTESGANAGVAESLSSTVRR